MKKIIYLIIVVMLSINCKAQLTIVPLQNKVPGETLPNQYIMDVDGLLNPYVGTWLYTDGTTSLKFVLRKEVNDDNGFYHEDVLYGEYQYIKDGVEKINTLSQIDNVYTAQSNHTIGGNEIITGKEFVSNGGGCDDCNENEKRVLVFMGDPLTGGDAANLVMRRITVSGQPAISAYIFFGGLKTTGTTLEDMDTETVGNTIPNGTYILIKQP